MHGNFSGEMEGLRWRALGRKSEGWNREAADGIEPWLNLGNSAKLLKIAPKALRLASCMAILASTSAA